MQLQTAYADIAKGKPTIQMQKQALYGVQMTYEYAYIHDVTTPLEKYLTNQESMQHLNSMGETFPC